MDELQVENGNFTRIVNPLIEQLIKIPFKGCELAVALYIIRKTYGFQKKQDEISLSQFQNDLQRARSTINLALKTLQLVGVVKLVRKGNMKGACNVWAINKYYQNWNLVGVVKLVRQKNKPSMTERLNLVGRVIHTKETNKRNTKEISKTEVLQGKEWNNLIDAFKEVNPMYLDFYKNKTERKALESLASKITYGKLLNTIKALPSIINRPYAPKITSPTELKRDLGKLIVFHNQTKDIKKDNKGVTL